MLQYILDMGPFGLLNVLILFIIFLFALKNAYLLFVKKQHNDLARLGRSINTMLFWGVIVIIIGFIGTAIGMQSAIHSMNDAFGNSPSTFTSTLADSANFYYVESLDELKNKDLRKNMDPPPDLVVYKPKDVPPEGLDIPDDQFKEPDTFLVFLGAIYLLLKLPIFSLTSFLVISLVWYLFTSQHRRLLARSMKEQYEAG